MAYDRDEWRTPWSVDPAPDDAPAPTAAPDDALAPSVAPDTWGAPAPSDPGAAAPFDAPTATASGDPTTRPAAPSGHGPTVVARFPQPPPSAWDATAGGPGSPPGSVRPPDTTGTHDAPPAATKRGRTLLVAVVGGLVGALVGGGIVAAVTDDRGVSTPLTSGGNGSSAPTIEVDGEVSDLIPTVAAAVLPSVVSIDVPAEELGGNPLQGGGPALGSGVIYRSDGYILTNNHVVGEAEEVTVRLGSGDILEAEVVGTDELNDLAVVLVRSPDDTPFDLPAINLRTEPDLQVGEGVIAIGSPFGLDGSVTTGIVSGLNRDLNVGEDADGAGLVIPSVIQTDAAINPGNSGGALVDARGQLIGINTAILTRTGGSQGVGFAVPVGQSITSADQIIEQGFVRHSLLGIAGTDVLPDVAEEFGLEAPRGAIVESVQDGTGAEEAGVQAGDIIVSVDGEPLATMSQLIAEVRSRAPGDTVTLGLVRDGGEDLELEVVLSERPRS